ncbi:carbohydrate ABC transporter permease [Pelagibius sp.]|uniref:carbohydrate ABC transporter permease n=1 Tax=Pelagibius sp. TaxID=1931238 RepID=UPI0026164B1D|nr:sugar ABC transporter permease [Pelagibius sp.]
MASFAPASGFAASQRARQTANFVLFLGPALVLLALFFVLPVIVDITIAFTDMGQTLRVSEFTTKNFERMLGGDRRLSAALGLTLIYVFCTLAVFNVTFGLVLALTTTAIPDRVGSFFRAVWLLPRMSPSVVYALLWAWVVDPTERGLLNQFINGAFGFEVYDMMNDHPLMLIVLANGFIGASMGMIIFTSAIRSIPEHLFYAARADGAGGLHIVWHVILPAIRWPLSFITVYQTLSLLVSFEYIWLITNGGPFFDTTVYALYVYQRAFENGQYAYGAALALVLVVIGIAAALLMWRFMDMKRLLQQPRIEVQ